jgi:3-phenylpropionate/trans-cinnamate dioxygenase ferredoxin subunit
MGSYAEDNPVEHEAVRVEGLRDHLVASGSLEREWTTPVALYESPSGDALYDAGPADTYADETITARQLGDAEVVVIRQGGEFFALPDRCTHQRYPLNDGELLEGKIRCVHHGATFDLRTGRPTLPAVVKIRLFQVDVVEGRVLVSMQER